MPKVTYNQDSYRAAFSDWLTGAEQSDGEWRAFCPLCEDPDTSKTPSASFNFQQGVFACFHDSAHSGSLQQLKKRLKDEKGFNFRSAQMKGRQNKSAGGEPLRSASKPLPSEREMTSWHKRLMNTPERLKVMTDQRGLTEETLEKWNIGWDGERYTIPVYDENFQLVNVRRYKPNTTGNNKMMSWSAGHGTARLFALPVLEKSDTIVLCEGEMDCMVLNQFDIPATTHTAGASTFKAEWAFKFTDKTVYICYDVDDAGKAGAKKAMGLIRKYARAVYIVELPDNGPGYDVTDFVIKEGEGPEGFRELMRKAAESHQEPTIPAERPAPPTEGLPLALEASMSQEHKNDVIEMTVTIAGKQNPPFQAPHKVHVTCDMAAGPKCLVCPIERLNGDTEIELQPDDQSLFQFLRLPPDKWPGQLRRMVGAKCTDHVDIETKDAYNLEHLIVGNAVEERDPGVSQAPLNREMYSVSTHNTAVNTTVKIVGRNVLDPRDARLSFMAWHNEPKKTDLDRFVLTDELREGLFSTFKPSPDQSPLDKCDEIADAMAKYVTHIYGRQNLHVAYDLVWHSPLSFRLDGDMLDKGWLEMMVVGDTRTGKSETAIRLAEHYRAGTVKSCEGATFAGLVGGAQQMGNKGPWTVTWGLIPLNDRRLVVLDEVSGLKDKDVIEQMSSIRSSGRAEMTKIVSEETSARTRLIWITNPGDGSMVGDHPDAGMQALRTVVKSNEDIARFDFVMAATANEVDTDIINSARTTSGKNEFTPELCQALILWAWSRTPEQIHFTPKAIKLSRELAKDIGRRYINDPPLVQAENVRYKICRIAAAIAARTFSVYEESAETLVVMEDHVRDAVRFLDRVYEFEGMGYARKSRRTIRAREMARERQTACRQFLQANSDTVLHTLQSIGGSKFRPRDFVEIGGMQTDAAHAATHKLIGWKMVTRGDRGQLSMGRTLQALLKEFDDMEDEDLL